MLIEAKTLPIEVILSLTVYDQDGRLIPNIIRFDTDTLLATQCVLFAGGRTICKDVQAASFEFRSDAATVLAELERSLPVELHQYIVFYQS